MTTPPKERLQVTPGRIHLARLGGRDLYNDKRAYMGTASGPGAQAQANARLWCDAHNTYNKVHLLPSEMADKLEAQYEIVTRQGNEIARLHARHTEAQRIIKQAHDAIDALNDGGMGPLTSLEGVRALIACSDFLSQFPTPQTTSEG